MPIDLRSDTVTQPSAAMRDAIAKAPLGDDVYAEDPSVNELQDDVAKLLGKQAALFVPSGTMSNQLALMAQTERGDEVVIGERAHCAWFESGAAAALSGVQFATAGNGGLFTVDEFKAAVKPSSYYLPRTSLVAVENTHNASGGRVFPLNDVVAIAEAAHSMGLKLHLDGARLWNAAATTGVSVAELAGPADSISVCFSKGLGAPVGSALVGSRALIERARRMRKMLGGGMRQAGILAAGALYALRNNQSRLVDDHRHARFFAENISGCRGVRLDLDSVQTNIVLFEVPGSAEELCALAKESGVLLSAMGPRSVRAVTHLDVSFDEVREAASSVARLLEGGRG
ncbi:MAG: low specificity L-threonine aldolase [Polyangiaceae bacterium]